MNAALITYFDANRKKYADVSADTAKNFASLCSLDWVCESTGSVEKNAYFKKVELCLRELELGRPYVLYADVDIVFNLEPDTKLIESATKPLTFLTDGFRTPCTGMMLVRNDEQVKELLKVWKMLGMVDNNETEQETILLLYRRFAWIRKLVGQFPFEAIPDTSTDKAGTVGKHFYSRVFHPALAHMDLYRRTYYDPIPAP